MARSVEIEKPGSDKLKELEAKFNKLNEFCYKLLLRLEKTEPKLKELLKDDADDGDIYLVPTGEFFGKKY